MPEEKQRIVRLIQKPEFNFYKKTGDKVKAGETVATLCASDKEKLKGGVEYLKNGYFFGDQQVDPMKNIIAEVTKDSVIDN